MRRLFLFSLLLIGFAQAEFDKVATTAAPFLKLPVGGRANAMGGAFVALADDGFASYWNPAGMSAAEGTTISASHSDWLLDISLDHMGLILPTRPNEWFGLSVTSLSMGDQLVRTIEEPEGTGLEYGVQDLALSASYTRQITDRLAVGSSAKMIHLQAYNETAQTFAIDLGSILRTNFYGMKIGMALSNFGGDILFKGRDLIIDADISDDLDGNYRSDADLRTESWPIPLMIRIGVSMDLLGGEDAPLKSQSSRLTLALDADHPNDGPEHLNLGLEYGLREMFYFRGGYRHNYDQENGTLGTGVRLPLAGAGTLVVDYAVKPMKVLGNTSILSLSYTR